MKNCLCLVYIFLFFLPRLFAQQNIGIGTSTPDPSALLEVQSIDKGMLIPRVSTAQRTSISNAATGLLVFDSTTSSFWFKSATNWIELVDSANNAWKKVGNNAALATTGNVGIGTISPGYDLQISRPAPTIGLSDTEHGALSGTISGDSADLIINARRKPFGSTTAGNIVLQAGSGINTIVAGNVGIGVSSPLSKLDINGDQRVNGSLTFQNNLSNKGKISIAGSDMVLMATHPSGNLIFNATGDDLFRITPGGNAEFGTGAPGSFVSNITIDNTGQIKRPQVTGTAGLVPVCYGKINSSGNVLGGTGNFTVNKPSEGRYNVTISSEPNMYADRAKYMVLVTTEYLWGHAIYYNFGLDNTLQFTATSFDVPYSNRSCKCANLGTGLVTFSYLTGGVAYFSNDVGFNFVVFKL